MSIFSASSRSFKAQVADDGRCPLCEQPIAQDLARRIEVKEREQRRAALELARAEALAAAEQKIAAAHSDGMLAAQASMQSKLLELEKRAAQADEAKTLAKQEIEALKEAQDALVSQRLHAAQEALQREKENAVLAEKAKVLKLQSELQDMQRKLESKSAHELGEGSELDLYEQLRTAFEGDRIRRVGKGVNGADVIHEVVHNGRVCGKIIYDAKNRNAWQNEFVNKLRADKLAEGADHAVLSSNKFPKGKEQVHLQEGVVIAAPARVVALAELMREQILRLHQLRASQDEREKKTDALYDFMTSPQCKHLIDQVETQAGRMLELDAKEQEAHRRVWDSRNKLIRSVQKAKSDLCFEIDRIIGTAGNGPAASIELSWEEASS